MAGATRWRWHASVALWTSMLLGVDAMYLVLRQGEGKRCFTFDQPHNEVVHIRYTFPDWNKGKPVIVTVHPQMPQMENAPRGGQHSPRSKIARFEAKEEKGTLDYTIPIDGSTKFCVSAPKATSPLRFSLDLTTVPDEAWYEEASRKQKLDGMELALLRLNGMMDAILTEADYMKEKEVIFHHDSEKMNATALWWPILQVMILLATGVFQVKYLKTFFKARRLV